MSQYLNTIITGIGVSDIIDILIISYIVYRLLSFIRSSRTKQLAHGLLILIGAAVISSAKVLHFYTLHWVLSKLLDVGLVALIVVFQPELRRALEVIGRSKFGVKQISINRERITETVNSIICAIDYFSQIKEGALIVIERETALEDIAETGTLLDAKLTESALENIFYKGAPLHDGAVILRGERIFAAGCVLPLTSNQNLSKDLGTRHRAGIGISEVSDALVFIVSEETGIISMAVDGKISRFLDLKMVEKILLNHYFAKFNTQRRGSIILEGLFKRKNDEIEKNS